jgi:hypothetical protein
MRTRPTLIDRAMYVVARGHAQRVYDQFIKATQRAVAVQERVLAGHIRRNADTDFGRDHHFDRVRSVEDLRRQLPILTYEDHEPYIERVRNGQINALFGGRQRVHMFALTSGTSDRPKHIPVTDEFLKAYRRGWNAFGIKALLDHPQAFLRGIVQITSRMDESLSPAGIPCGAITGLMAATQKRLVRKYYVAPQCLAQIDDPAAKYYTIMRLAVASDVAFTITASPATQLKLARAADEHREQLIRDIHDGTLWPGLPVPDRVRDILKPRLRADRVRARELDSLATSHGALLPRHYWQLAFIANWTGGTMGLYLQDFPRYFGDVPVRDIGLLASEGRISIPVQDHTPAGILDVESHFFEFVPADRIDEVNPPAMSCHQLDVGQEYFVLLTTASGLYRYHIGDLVRVTGYSGQAPIVEFLSKGAHTCSLAGEKLTEYQVMQAMARAAEQTKNRMANFVLAPRWGHPPFYVLHADAPAPPGEAIRADLAVELDAQLCITNIEYASRRRSERLGPIRLNLLPTGFLADLDHRQAESRRKGNEQFKHRYLYCRPGEDAIFPDHDDPAV